MRLLIDGYNLLHVTDLFGSGKAAGTLQGSREALLNFLAAAMSASDRRITTIVFDAAGAPPGLPRTVHHDHLTVRYAREYADADALLEELIESHRAPRGLLVVSSDHRVQRAARRRGAKHADSDVWYRQLVAKQTAVKARQAAGEKPAAGGSVDFWVGEFASAEIEQMAAELRHKGTPLPDRKASKRPPTSFPAAEGQLDNPFPPGYAEDLLEGE